MTQLEAIRDALRRRGAYKRVFLADNPDARLVLTDLLREADPRHSWFSPGKPDVTAHNNGARDFAAGMLRKIFGSDAELHRQMKELYEQEHQ